MKIGILTAVWQRLKIFEIFATGVNRLRDQFDITPVVVGSEGEVSKNLCKKYGFLYLERPNYPLGRKFNAGLQVFKIFHVDYVIVMGSDDLISNSLIEAYMPYMKRGRDLIGILDIYFYDIRVKQLHYLAGYGNRPQDKHRRGEPLGLARCISNKMINLVNWHLWDNNVNKGLDWTMWQNLRKVRCKPITIRLTDINSFAVDLKSGHNICDLGIYRTIEVDDKIMRQSLSNKELKLIDDYTILSGSS